MGYPANWEFVSCPLAIGWAHNNNAEQYRSRGSLIIEPLRCGCAVVGSWLASSKAEIMSVKRACRQFARLSSPTPDDRPPAGMAK